MRVRIFTLLVSSILAFSGCESGPNPAVGGAGGSSDGGGPGGDGGGGSGGQGGAGPRCGDGVLDADEACDDGNTVDGDGCSSGCLLEGSCERPIEWSKVSFATEAEAPNLFILESMPFQGQEVVGRGFCGGGGAKMVFRYEVPATGRLSLQMLCDKSLNAAVFYARTVCDDPSTEIEDTCQGRDSFTGADVEEGQVLYLVFDSFPGEESGNFAAATEVFPFSQEGESCEPVPVNSAGRCAPGLTCWDQDHPGVCAPAVAPVLTAARSLRDGANDETLLVYLAGEDSNGDALDVDAWAYDSEGEPVTLIDQADWEGERNYLALGLDRSPFPLKSFRILGRPKVAGLLASHPEIHRIDVRMDDMVGLTSNLITTIVEDQPKAVEGEVCDPLVEKSACENSDLMCAEDGDTEPRCASLAPSREARCGDAPELELGERLVVDLALAEGDMEPLWSVPLDCFDRFSPWSPPLELAFRFTLTEERTNAAIEIAGQGGASTILSVFRGCGPAGPPVACNEAAQAGTPAARIAFPRLEAGTYVAVVSLPQRARTKPFNILLSADPLE